MQGQARGDSARSLGGKRIAHKLMVSLQPCARGELLRCSLRLRRPGAPSEGTREGAQLRTSWRHVDRVLNILREALAAWLPRLSFNAGVRCPSCGGAGRAHPIDLQAVLHDEIVMCPRVGELVEDLPVWLMEWRGHLWRQLSEPVAEHAPKG